MFGVEHGSLISSNEIVSAIIPAIANHPAMPYSDSPLFFKVIRNG